MDKIEEAKHDLALYVELVLYPSIREIEEDNNIRKEIKLKMRDEQVEDLVRYWARTSEILTEGQIREHIILVLERTINNIRDLKEKREQEER